MLPAGVEIYGGFDGTESTPDARDIETNKTILNGAFINAQSQPDSVYHVVTAIGDMAGTILDGVTITGGKATGSSSVMVDGDSNKRIYRNYGGGIYLHQVTNLILSGIQIKENKALTYGGGIYMSDSDPTITNVEITNNLLTYSTSYGGGMYLQNSSPAIEHTKINNNTALYGGGGMHLNTNSDPIMEYVEIDANSARMGGGMYINSSSPVMSFVSITNNIYGTTGSSHGGGIYNNNSTLEMTNMLISGNYYSNQAATSNMYGGGIYNNGNTSSITINKSIIKDNEARAGGGIYNNNATSLITNTAIRNNTAKTASGGGGIYNNGTTAHTSLTNVLLAENKTTATMTGGGAIYNYQGTAEIVNTTISGHHTSWYVIYNTSTMEIKNSILWGNTAMALINNGATGRIDFYNSLIEGVYDSDGTWKTTFGTDKGNNIASDAMFTDATTGDYTLTIYSPAIGKGNNSYIMGYPTDLAGNDRIYGGNVDMGAYELHSQPAGPDSNGILYISETGDGEKRGNNWEDAFPGLANALEFAEANPDVKQLWLKAGTYVPEKLTDPNNQTASDKSFYLIRDIEIYGGFAGTETSPAAREPGNNPTILNGVIGNSGVATDSVYHVVTAAGDMGSALLDGVTITGGRAYGNSSNRNGYGGGVYLNQASGLMISNTIITGNYARNYGGGIYNHMSSATLENVTISHNKAQNFGGGMAVFAGTSVITNSNFNNNTSYSSGGALYLQNTSSGAITGTRFTENTATSSTAMGGAIYLAESSPLINRVLIKDNTATYRGGGIYTGTGSNPAIVNTIITGNTSNEGGAMGITSEPTLTNVTMTNNTALDRGGAMYNTTGSNPRTRNSIIWNNKSRRDGAIYNLVAGSGTGQATFEYTLLQDAFDASGNWKTANGINAGNNIDANPRFTDPEAEDFHLVQLSPARNKGNNSYYAAGSTPDIQSCIYDYEDNDRFHNNGVVDLGAYEAQWNTWLEIKGKTVAYNGQPHSIDSVYVKEYTDRQLVTIGEKEWVQYHYFNENGQKLTQLPVSPGIYDVIASFSGHSHYEAMQSDTVQLTIQKASIHLTLNSETQTYTGEPLHISPAIITGNVGTVPAITYTYTKDNISTDHALGAGIYTVTASFAGDNNHEALTSDPVTFEVEKARPVIHITLSGKEYDGTPVEINQPTLTGSTTVHTLLPDLTYSYINSENTYGPTPVPPTDAGEYTLTISTSGDANHKAAQTEGSFTIGSNIPAITLASRQVTYNGQSVEVNDATIQPAGAQHLTIKYKYAGTLKDGTAYPETENAPTDAGDYTVTAWTEGDHNYASISTTAALEIRKKQTGIIMQSKSAPYTGKPISIDDPVTDPAGIPLLITYQGQGATTYNETAEPPVDKGNYLVIATWGGDNNYTAATATANLTIAETGALQLSLSNKTAIYNGQPIAINDAVIEPAEAQYLPVKYKYAGTLRNGTAYPETENAPVDAGIYTVTAWTEGDQTYGSVSTTVTLEITQKQPVIVMQHKSAPYTGNTISIDNPVTDPAGISLRITYKGQGTTTYRETANPPVEKGTYLVTATWEGDNNHTAATATANLTITDQDALRITLSSKTATYNGQPVVIDNAVIEPAEAQYLPVRYKYTGTLYDGTLYPETENAPVDAGTYTVTARTDGDNTYGPVSTTATLEIKQKEPGITLQNKSTPYTGNAISIDDPVTDPAGIVLSVSYKGQGTTTYYETAAPPVEPGTYLVTASYEGDNNHTGKTVTANLTITREGSLRLSLNNRTVTYTGQPVVVDDAVIEPAEAQSLTIRYNYAGTLYDGTIYPETETAPVDAGNYTVTAWTDGDQTYGAVSTTATLEITKKQSIIIMVNKSVTYTGSPVPIDDPVTDPAGITLSVTYKGQGATTYYETATPPVEPGTYLATAMYEGNNNYTSATTTANLTITNDGPVTPVLTLTDKIVSYNGTAQSVTATISPSGAQYLEINYKYAGALHDGTLYPETENPPVDAGEYTVTAWTDGDQIYNPASTTATLRITQKQPVITLVNKTVPYIGEAISIDDPVTDPADIPLTITYKGQGETIYQETAEPPVETGTYLVTATWEGDNNHTAGTATGNLTIIANAVSPQLTLSNKTVTYNGAAQSIGEVIISPEEAQYLEVRYQYSNAGYGPSETPPTDAGVYTVTASTLADEKFTAASVTATLTIEKADQVMTFPAIPDKQTGDEPFKVGVTVDTGLPVTYESGNPYVASITNDGTITIHRTGTVTITAKQAGNNNYNEVFRTQVLTITSNDTRILSLTVNGEAITIGENMYYDLGCSDLSDIPVVITTEEDATVDTGKSFTVTVDKPMLKTVQFTVTSQDGKANKTYTLMIEKRFDFDAIVKIRWNNTLTVINNSNFNGGYTFTSFKWYRNGEELTDHQSWSAGNNGEELDPSDIFYVEVTANEFEGTLRTCEGSPILSSNRVTVYPNPVEAGSEIVVDADIDETFLEGATIDIYSMSGNRIKNVPVTGQKTTFRFDAASGTYMFKLNGANDFTHETKIIVK
ncbi:MAG: MBG domain-containing protein [Candidatus Azobacteroides sp.]|nr:MBG domain-containing protein [Candidatus Azobacteroides sp.]